MTDDLFGWVAPAPYPAKGATFDRRGERGHGHDDAGPAELGDPRSFKEGRDESRGDVKVDRGPLGQGAKHDNMTRRAADEVECAVTNVDDVTGAGVDSDECRLVKNDATSRRQSGRRRANIDCDVGGHWGKS